MLLPINILIFIILEKKNICSADNPRNSSACETNVVVKLNCQKPSNV